LGGRSKKGKKWGTGRAAGVLVQHCERGRELQRFRVVEIYERSPGKKTCSPIRQGSLKKARTLLKKQRDMAESNKNMLNEPLKGENGRNRRHHKKKGKYWA